MLLANTYYLYKTAVIHRKRYQLISVAFITMSIHPVSRVHTDSRCGSEEQLVWCCGPIYGPVRSAQCFDGPPIH